MQKRIIAGKQPNEAFKARDWLDLEELAEVELTSEDPAYLIEAALSPRMKQGWRADRSGKQTIRLLFMQPQQVQRIQLSFIEAVSSRTKKFVLRLSRNHGESLVEIVRQQWNFSPEGGNTESGQQVLELSGVTLIELSITQNLSGQPVIAFIEKNALFKYPPWPLALAFLIKNGAYSIT